MRLRFRTVHLRKRRALALSRGVYAGSENLFLEVSEEGITGLGEMAPITYGDAQTAAGAMDELSEVETALEQLKPWQVHRLEKTATDCGVRSGALAALNVACWDWVGKSLGVPVYRLLGLEPATIRTSITLGIATPDAIRESVPELLALAQTDELKTKLGSPEGVEADKEAFLAAKSAAPAARLRADANGGWSLQDARSMTAWLAREGCAYIEQPLSLEADEDLTALHECCPLPIFLDESVHTPEDVARLAGRCDGVNVKLMKCGGISQAMRVVHTARALGLSMMIGCFSESSVGISAAASIASLFDYVDLDSHLNLDPDPAEGCRLEDGRVIPLDEPGIGARLR